MQFSLCETGKICSGKFITRTVQNVTDYKPGRDRQGSNNIRILPTMAKTSYLRKGKQDKNKSQESPSMPKAPKERHHFSSTSLQISRYLLIKTQLVVSICSIQSYKICFTTLDVYLQAIQTRNSAIGYGISFIAV